MLKTYVAHVEVRYMKGGPVVQSGYVTCYGHDKPSAKGNAKQNTITEPGGIVKVTNIELRG